MSLESSTRIGEICVTRRGVDCASRSQLSSVYTPSRKSDPDDAMSSEATRRAPMMPLRELVDRYLATAGSFGLPAALSSFGVSQAETERLFSGYDEDYHISRFFHFSGQQGTSYSINGFPATHVSIDHEIQSIL